MDFHQTRVSFEKVLQDYIKYRAQLEDEVTSIINFRQIVEHVKSAEILGLLKDRLNKIPDLILSVGRAFNNMTQWSVTDKPDSVGITWFRLGKQPRQPFHLFVDIGEAEEIADLVKTVYTIASDEVLLVDVSAFSSLVECMTPELEPLSTGALVFFKELEEEKNESDPSDEQV